jgi:flagellar basal-body rod protein FlgB
MSDISLLNAASELAKHANARHSVIARNIANADSPNYQAKDIAEFSLDDSDFRLRVTKAGHLPAVGQIPGSASYTEKIIENAAIEPNGNTVSLEDQMMRSVQAQGQHNRALAIYQKSMDLLRLTIGR